MTHLQREEEHRQAVVDGDVGRRAERERRLAHRRAGADDVQRVGLQPRQQLVQVVVAGGHAGERAPPLVGGLQVVEGLAEQLRQRAGRVGDLVVGQLEDLVLGLVEGLGDVVGLVVGDLGDLAGHPDEAAEQRGVAHDAAVAAGVGDGRRRGLQVEQEARAADVLQHPGPPQLVGHRDRVGRLARADERAHGVVDELVGRLVEVLGADPELGHRGDGVRRQEQRAEQRRLGLDVVRRNPAGAAPRPSFRALNHAADTLAYSSCGLPEDGPGTFQPVLWIVARSLWMGADGHSSATGRAPSDRSLPSDARLSGAAVRR